MMAYPHLTLLSLFPAKLRAFPRRPFERSPCWRTSSTRMWSNYSTWSSPATICTWFSSTWTWISRSWWTKRRMSSHLSWLRYVYYCWKLLFIAILPPFQSYMHQILDALGFCHTNRILHRDLKPQNLLVDTAGKIKVRLYDLPTWFSNNNLYSL